MNILMLIQRLMNFMAIHRDELAGHSNDTFIDFSANDDNSNNNLVKFKQQITQ